MHKKAMRKDFYMEIRRSMGRFMSIFFIVALGVAFFSGIRSAQPDMLLTGDSYFDRLNLMDIRAVSTLGVTENDIKSIAQADGVEQAVGAYSVDVLCRDDANQKVLHIASLTDDMNTVEVLEGRLPEKKDECLVDARTSYKIGDVIWVESGDDTPITDTLRTDKLKVVGIGSSPCYISLNRGSSMIGTGSVSGFVMVDKSAFHTDVFTEIYIRIEDTEKLRAYSNSYEDKVEEIIDKVEAIAETRGKIRRDSLVGEANEELEDAKKKLEDGKKEAEEKLNDARVQIADGEKQISDAKAQIADGESQITSAKTTLTEKQRELNTAKKQYQSGKQQYANGLEQYQQGVAAYEEGLAQYQQGVAAYEEVLTQYQQGAEKFQQQKAEYEPLIQAGREELAEQRIRLDAIWEYYNLIKKIPGKEKEAEEIKAQLDAGETAYTNAKEELDGYERQLAEGENVLEETKAQLAGAKEQLDENKLILDQTEAELAVAKAKLDASDTQLKEAEAQMVNGQVQINSGWDELQTQERKLADAKSEIASKEPELADAKNELAKAERDAETEIADGEAKIADAQEEIQNIPEAKWYVNDRSALPEHMGYGENADRMKAIGQVFPVLFFLVAALISLTSMTRMVEEQRTQIGTMKALGYGKFAIASKYLGYAFVATLGGSVLGVLVGEKVIPYIIVYAYSRTIYPYMMDIKVPYNMYYAVMATAAALLCTLAATMIACYRELASQPAVLMRPPAPKKGKRVFMERITFIWKHLSFIWKSTIRNMFRYKKRFFMTIFGIGGCMALMLVGFGLKDSIFEIAGIQYKEIQIYDGMAYLKEDVSEEDREALVDDLEADKGVESFLNMNMKNVTLIKDSVKWNVYQAVPEDMKEIDSFVKFHDRISGEVYELDDEGVILNEKSAKKLEVKVGDTLEIQDTENGNHEVKVAHICENYMSHYLYMSKTLYEEIYGRDFEPNCIYFTASDDKGTKLEETGERILNEEAVLNVSYLSDIEEQLNNMLKTLNLVTMVLIISAGMLAFVVLYNLNNINITERRRELATLKVLGFYDQEVSAYVYRENIILTLIGVVVGCGLGAVLHRFIIETVEVDSVMFGRIINRTSYIYSMLFTIGFSCFVNWVMYFKLKKIDMVESLKSVE